MLPSRDSGRKGTTFSRHGKTFWLIKHKIFGFFGVFRKKHYLCTAKRSQEYRKNESYNLQNNQTMDNELIQKCRAIAQQWLDSPVYDDTTKAEVKAMLDDPDTTALVDAFYQTLEFGTGGLRGIMGAGTNRMNRYIVGAATQGFANYINKAFPDKKDTAVVVGHDCRNHGREFAETVANIFSANGIKVYLFEGLRPTPEISFAIRQLKAQAGVNVTASHNPKEYNGYKAYWDDGAQVLSPHDKGIIDEVNKVKVEDVKWTGNPDLIQIIGGEMDWDYLQAVKEAMVDQEVINRQKDLNIVYTPLHGTGRVIICSGTTWMFWKPHERSASGMMTRPVPCNGV